MYKSYMVEVKTKQGEFIDYNVCESLKDAKRYAKVMSKNFLVKIIKRK